MIRSFIASAALLIVAVVAVERVDSALSAPGNAVVFALTATASATPLMATQGL